MGCASSQPKAGLGEDGAARSVDPAAGERVYHGWGITTKGRGAKHGGFMLGEGGGGYGGGGDGGGGGGC